LEFKDVTDIIASAHGVLDKLEARVSGSWLHRAFWHGINVRWYTPPVLIGRSWELDYPYRKSRTVVLRYSFRRSLVLGFWGKKGYDEDTALLEATIYGRERTNDERRAWDETQLFMADEASGVLLEGRPGLRVRATFDDRSDA
jgi:hypothetical protein